MPVMRTHDDVLYEKLRTLCYDGDSIFNHDYRHFAPLSVDMTAERWWWPEYFKYKDKDERFYAKEHQIPEGYLIVSRESFEPSSAYEEVRSIVIDMHQIAIPMKWYFKIYDMDLFRQWDVIRMNILSLPQKLRRTDSLFKAMDVAYQYGIEEELKGLFYDLKVDNPQEQERRVKVAYEKERTAKMKVKDCENKILALRADKSWNRDYEMLYLRYARSGLSQEIGFVRYLEKYGNLTQTGWGLVLKSQVAGNLANKIAILSDELVVLKQRFRDAHLARLFEDSRYSFL